MGKPLGILTLLDEECKYTGRWEHAGPAHSSTLALGTFPKATEESFVLKLDQKFADHVS